MAMPICMLADSAARKRLHELLWLYGVDRSACLPADPPAEACEFCKVQDTREDKVQGNFPSLEWERWAYREEGDDGPGNGAISPREKRRRAEAAKEERERSEERSEMTAEWQRNVLDPTDFVSDQQEAVETPAETGEISEVLSNGGGDGNGAGLSRPSLSRSAEPPGATGKMQGAKSTEPASISKGAEKPGEVGRLAPPGSNGGEHGERENGAGIGEHDENQGDFGMDAEALRREGREDRDLRERIRYDVMHPSEEEVEEETRKRLEQEDELGRPRPDDTGERPNLEDLDDIDL
jgi:hypothetical protein